MAASPLRSIINRRAVLAGLGLSAFGLAACGDGSPSGGTAAKGTGGAGGAGLTKITVGALPIADVAPLHLGKAKGFFSEVGLDLDIQPTTGGAVAVPGVVSGNYDFAFANYVSLLVARDQGLDLRCVANASTSSSKLGADVGAVVVPADSPIKSPKDLQGRKCTSNQLQNIGDTTVRAVVDKDGGDGSKVTFIEIAFPDAMNALDNKQVDSVLLVEPFITPALAAGARAIMWPYAQVAPDLDMGGYFTMGARIKDEPDLVKKFTTAMDKSLTYAQEHEDEVRAALATYTKTPAELLAKIFLPRYLADFRPAGIEAMGEAARRYQTISKAPDVTGLLAKA